MIWKLSIEVPSEAEEAVAEWLSRNEAAPITTYVDVELRRGIVSVWFPRRPKWDEQMKARLRAGLEAIGRCGLRVTPARMVLTRVRRKDWAESWKRHFPPLEIGRRLLVRPSWSRRRARPRQAMVVMDPGLSFGTGQHPTTAFCLEQIASFASRNSGRSASRACLLDLGTGSGILAVAAAKLGYEPVCACDIDPDAIRVARANARRNRVSGKIRFARANLARLPLRSKRRFDVVCANLTADLLLAQQRRILNRLAPEGLVVLAGILASEFPSVQRAYESAGLRLTSSRLKGEWRSGAFRRMALQGGS